MKKEEIKFQSHGVELAGMFTLPNKMSCRACVVMVHGSGPQDRHGNMKGFDSNIFKELSTQLVDAGFATFCYDKRGCGVSQGNFKVAGLEEVIQDAHSAINRISEHANLDNQPIYLLGHSEGACLAPEIASNNGKVSGVIMLCASLRSFEEDGIKNAEIINRDLDAMPGLRGKIARLFFYTKDPAKTMRELREKVENTGKDSIWVSFTKVSTKFYRETFQYDVKFHLESMSKPILAIGGEKDFQCHPDDTRLIPKVTKACTNTIIVENMDHTLRKQVGRASFASYKASISSNIIGQVPKAICVWLNDQIESTETKEYRA